MGYGYVKPHISIFPSSLKEVITVKVDKHASSRQIEMGGYPYRYLIVFKNGTDGIDFVQFKISIPRNAIRTPMYGLGCKCKMQFVIQIKTEGDLLLHQFKAPNWEMATYKPSGMKLILPSQTIIDEPTDLLVALFGGKYGLPTYDFEGQVTIIKQSGIKLDHFKLDFDKKDVGVKMIQVQFQNPGVYRLHAMADNGFTAVSNPIEVGKVNKEKILWGDLHMHSIYSWDSRNLTPICRDPRETFSMARKFSLLDFIALTDHGQHDSFYNHRFSRLKSFNTF